MYRPLTDLQQNVIAKDTIAALEDKAATKIAPALMKIAPVFMQIALVSIWFDPDLNRSGLVSMAGTGVRVGPGTVLTTTVHEAFEATSKQRIPTGFRLEAQGCEQRATLGKAINSFPTLKELRRAIENQPWLNSPSSVTIQIVVPQTLPVAADVRRRTGHATRINFFSNLGAKAIILAQ